MAVPLLIAGIAIVFTAAYIMAARSAADAALAGEHTAVGLADAGSETLVGGHLQPRACSDWQLTTVNDLHDAEDLLDCLEAQGIDERELVVLGNSCFAVRWR